MFISETSVRSEPAGPQPALQRLNARVLEVRAAGEPTRLRMLALLRSGELTVGELAQALGQSQPRVSRHLKLLSDTGLAERAQEGAWVFCRLAPPGARARVLAEALLGDLDPEDPILAEDARRLREARAAREEAAAAYFASVAGEWNTLRKLHLPDGDIESALLAMAGPRRFGLMVDIGVGAGRRPIVFRDHAATAIGIDINREMLRVARAELDQAGLESVDLRRGDAYQPPLAPGSADLVVMHQVLHYLADPQRAITECVRLLAPGGVALICDFAKHGLEFLRDHHAHHRLGFSHEEIVGWARSAGAIVAGRRTLRPSRSVSGKGGLTVEIWRVERGEDAR